MFYLGLRHQGWLTMLLMSCRGKVKIWFKSLLIQKSYILIVVPSSRCSTQISEVSMSLCGEICLSNSCFWFWRVDVIIFNGTHDLNSNHVQWRLVLLCIGIVISLWFTVDENWTRVMSLKISFTFQLNREQNTTMPKYGRMHVRISKHAKKQGLLSAYHRNDKNESRIKNNFEKLLCILQFEVDDIIWRILRVSSSKVWSSEAAVNNKEKNTHKSVKDVTMQEETEGSPPWTQVFMSPQPGTCAQQICWNCYSFLQSVIVMVFESSQCVCWWPHMLR